MYFFQIIQEKKAKIRNILEKKVLQKPELSINVLKMKIPSFDYSSLKTDMIIDNNDLKNVSLMKRDTKKIDKFENFHCGNSLFQNLPRFMISVFWCCLNDAYYAHAQWSKSYY